MCEKSYVLRLSIHWTKELLTTQDRKREEVVKEKDFFYTTLLINVVKTSKLVVSMAICYILHLKLIMSF